jgi:hypothetical protein
LEIESKQKIIDHLDIEKNSVMIQPEEPKTPELPKIPGMHHRKKWGYIVNNIDLLPEQLVVTEKKVDDKKIRKMINEADGQIKIPGIDIFEEKIIVTRL